jgi:hypothetical protein
MYAKALLGRRWIRSPGLSDPHRTTQAILQLTGGYSDLLRVQLLNPRRHPLAAA